MLLVKNILKNKVNEFLKDYSYNIQDDADGFRLNFESSYDYYIQFSHDENIGWNVFIVPLSLDFDLTGEYEYIYTQLELIVDKINNYYYVYDEKNYNTITKNITLLKNYIYDNFNHFNIASVIVEDFILSIGLTNLHKNNPQLVEVGFSQNYDNWFFHHNNVDFLDNKNFEFIKSLKEYITIFNNN